MKEKVIIFKKFVPLILLVAFVSSCASMMNGDMVNVPVQISPAGSKLTVNGQTYTSPATVSVPRGEGNFTLHVEKEGYEPMDITLKQSIDGWLWGNLLFGGLIGVIIDFSTGDAYDIDPGKVNVTLAKSSTSYHNTGGPKVVLIDMSQLKPEQQEAVREYSKKD